MRASPLEHKIAEIATPVAQDLGLELVCVKIIGEGGSRNVQIMAQDPETARLGVDQCAKLSKALSVVLDVEAPINGAYRLEVSSPGIDRHLIKLEDFETYSGFKAKLETEMPDDNGRRKFSGLLRGVEGNIVKIETDLGLSEIAFESLAKAKLVLTDELIKAMDKA